MKRHSVLSPQAVKQMNHHEIIHFTNAVIKIQAVFRGQLTLKKLAQKAQSMQQSVRAERNANPEELALKEFVTQLKAKGLTPEAFFRICDGAYDKAVSASSFKVQIMQLKLKLTPNQIRRLTLIFDEDMEGQITLKEYQHALEAFNLQSDPHINTKSSQLPYRPFQERTMAFLVQVMQKHGYSPTDLFTKCNTDSSDSIDLEELKSVIAEIHPDIQIKQLQTIYNFLDEDKNGRVCQKEFVDALTKASGFIQEEDCFGEEDLGTGDQAIAAKPQPKKPLEIKVATTPSKNTKPANAKNVPINQKTFVECVEEFEAVTKTQIQKILEPYLIDTGSKPIKMDTLLKLAPKVNPDLIQQIWDLCDQDLHYVKVSQLVRQISKIPDRFKPQKEVLSKLCAQVKAPFAQTVSQICPTFKSGLTKTDWMNVFRGKGEPDLQIAVLFHNLAIQSQGQELVKFELLQTIANTARAETPVINKKVATQQDFQTARKTFFKSYQESDKEIAKLDYDPRATVTGCILTNENILQTLTCFAKCSDLIVTKEFISKTIKIVRDWIETFEGNDQQGVKDFFSKNFSEIAKQQHRIKSTNSLMFRTSLGNSQTIQKLTKYENILLTMLVTSTNKIYKLGIDREFLPEFLGMPEDGYKAQVAKFEDKCFDRLQMRARLCQIALVQVTINGHFDILNELTWEQIQFEVIASAMMAKLKDPAVKKAFLREFEQYEDKSLQYSEFYKLCTDQLGIKVDGQWAFLLTDLLDELDFEFKAKIQLKHVNYFLLQCGFDLGLAAEPETEVVQAKENPETYQIDNTDLFRGVKTIFNSEIAAMAYCQKVFEELKPGEYWEDPDFGPTASDPHGALSIYYEGECPGAPHPDVEDIQWLRPEEYLSTDGNTVNAVFVKNDSSSNEVKQGKMGNCWFISALSVLANNDQHIRGCGDAIDFQNPDMLDKNTVLACSMGVFPPIFHKFRTKDIYVLRFYKDYKWRYVVIDKKLPVVDYQLCFATCTDEEELWVPLIEKAYAKLFGCYEALRSGNIDEGLVDMTGFACEKKTLHDKAKNFVPNKEEFWQLLMEMYRRGCLMGCSRSGGTEHALQIEGQDTGILTGHAYGLNAVFEFFDENMPNARKSHRLVLIRNPWGNTEWQLKWGSGSEELETHEKAVQNIINEMEDDEQFNMQEDDGIFFMNYQSFRTVFDKIFIAQDFPPEWWCVRFSSAWTKENSGGLPAEKTPAANVRFAKNPQYLFQPSQDIEVFISLGQRDGRIVGEDGQYAKYPFKERLNATHLSVWELPQGQTQLKQYGGATVTAQTGVVRICENSTRTTLKAGKSYAVVCSTQGKEQTGDFYLSVYLNCDLHMCSIQRVGDPNERYAFIETEFEKDVNLKVPLWKYNWCKQIIENQDIITKTDVAAMSPALKMKQLTKKLSKQ